MRELVWGLFILYSQPEQHDKLLTYLNVDYGSKLQCGNVVDELNGRTTSNWYYPNFILSEDKQYIQEDVDFDIKYLCILKPKSTFMTLKPDN